MLLAAAGIGVSAWHGAACTELATLAGAARAGTTLEPANTTVHAGFFLTPPAIPARLVGRGPARLGGRRAARVSVRAFGARRAGSGRRRGHARGSINDRQPIRHVHTRDAAPGDTVAPSRHRPAGEPSMIRLAAAPLLSIALLLGACGDDSHSAAASGAASAVPASGDGSASAFNGGASAASSVAGAPVAASGQPPLAPPEVHYPPTAEDASGTSPPPPGGPGDPGTAVPLGPNGAPAGATGDNGATGAPPSQLPGSTGGSARTRG
ncbi:hypothetical protein Bpla01_14580 [Burkholderia plantarii]|nr:hypothetical protein Bpla01_14580 [Burkholderia plantarii]